MILRSAIYRLLPMLYRTLTALLFCVMTFAPAPALYTPTDAVAQEADAEREALPETEEVITRLIESQQHMLSGLREVELRYSSLGEPFETVRLHKKTEQGQAVLVPEDNTEQLAYFSLMTFTEDELRTLLGPAQLRADTLYSKPVLRFTLDAALLEGTPLLPDLQQTPLREAVFWLETEQLQLAGFRFRSVNRFGRTVTLQAIFPEYQTQHGFSAPSLITLSLTGAYAQISDEEYASQLEELHFLLDNLDTFPIERRAQAERELREHKGELKRMAEGRALHTELRLSGLIVR
ncbi:hypothetical protein CYPRO_2879 [Cyclonatronum proteinivorum]|uniref:Uncharacterized protein n=1 Tax=Cyclonatronum proteinivorum TaxID=1457365 RepID=A0A345UNR5_9BACT|nr:hypothetical protein [Cyclonatronum proteinivorum]AXJ02117.1 hypothetical protein CYPRO_2879 [Cyclonatronum proteinivorum]